MESEFGSQSQGRKRQRVAMEPEHLVGVTKECPRCRSTTVTFKYYNNKKVTQPRYECHGCKEFFTYGGKILPPAAVSPESVGGSDVTPMLADGMTHVVPYQQTESKGKERKRKAKEPPQYANMEKPCHQCGSNNTAFKYCNNGNTNQPRYKCLDCKGMFQFKPSQPSSPDDVQIAAADPCTPVMWLQSSLETQLDDEVDLDFPQPLESLQGRNDYDSWFLDAYFPPECSSMVPDVKLVDPHDEDNDLLLQLDDQSGEMPWRDWQSEDCGESSSPVCPPDEVDQPPEDLVDSFDQSSYLIEMMNITEGLCDAI